MTPEEREQKLTHIRCLPREELQGWWGSLGKHRQEFYGERAALLNRARQLNFTHKLEG